MIQRLRKALVPAILSIALVVTACSSKEPSRFQQAQRDSTSRNATPAVVKEATDGGNFNKFFPKSAAGFDRVFAQEKKGFVEAKLNKGGKNVAVMSVNDTISIPTTAKKFQKSTENLSGYPLLNEPPLKSTSILVNKRYQVKVISKDTSFTQSDRLTWLKKFDLNGLSKLK